MAKKKPMGLLINGSLKQSGVSFYLRNGEMIARSAHSQQPKRRTRAQFVARQQLTHACRLWAALKWAGEPLFDKIPSAYARFRTLMRRTEVVFIPCASPLSYTTLLLPGMPVSDGVLPQVGQWLAEVDGTAALVTDLDPQRVRRGDTFRLYTLRQVIRDGYPKVIITATELKVGDFQLVDGRLALVSDSFADEMSGWALVLVRGAKCSSQTVVTRCAYYQPFTTEEALLAAAESYGGLTDR